MSAPPQEDALDDIDEDAPASPGEQDAPAPPGGQDAPGESSAEAAPAVTTTTPPDATEGEENTPATAEGLNDDDDFEMVDKDQDMDNFSFYDLFMSIYNNTYYRAIVKSAIVFLVALKMARECNMMRIPMKEYKPFNRHSCWL